jgi:hypothetical protein
MLWCWIVIATQVCVLYFFLNYFRFIWISQSFLEYVFFFHEFLDHVFYFSEYLIFYESLEVLFCFSNNFQIKFEFHKSFMLHFLFFLFLKKTWVPRAVLQTPRYSHPSPPTTVHANTGISQMSNNFSPNPTWIGCASGIHHIHGWMRAQWGSAPLICQTKPHRAGASCAAAPCVSQRRP